ncbi:MAG: hypothetical protein ISS74_08715 [Planctomycetes bacterium]|nr:hypothetical protein [Planctomycetota bacterium]
MSRRVPFRTGTSVRWLTVGVAVAAALVGLPGPADHGLAAEAEAAAGTAGRAPTPPPQPIPPTPPEVAPPASPPDLPLPAPPAFYTVSIGRIPTIGPDWFEFRDDAGQLLRVVLADADSSQVHDRLHGHAETVAVSLLREDPVWVFPTGAEKGSADPLTLYARVWTHKGWLGEVLIRAGYALRREEVPPNTLGPVPPIAAPKGAPPAPADGAFASPVLKPAGGAAFEVHRQGKPVQVRLFDVTGRPDANPAAVALVAERSTTAGPAWVFPCGMPKPGEPLPVRVWTSHGWLDTMLVQENAAVALADPYKPPAPPASPATPAEKPKPDPPPAKPDPAQKPLPGPAKPDPPKDPEPAEGDIVWTPVTLTAKTIATGGMQGVETDVFEVPYGAIRMTWDCEPGRVGSIVILNLYRVDDQWQTRVSSHHVQTMKGQQGARALRVTPGRYWLKLSCTADLEGVKVEVAKPKK